MTQLDGLFNSVVDRVFQSSELDDDRARSPSQRLTRETDEDVNDRYVISRTDAAGPSTTQSPSVKSRSVDSATKPIRLPSRFAREVNDVFGRE
jgi:hypothetical protein